MKVLASCILFGGALLIGASGLMAQTNDSNSWREQWIKAKTGRYSSMEEARQTAEAENTAYREEPPTQTLPSADNWREQWIKAKTGRYSPVEESRQRAEEANTAYRAEPTAESPNDTWRREQWFKLKFGHYSPIEEAREKGESR